MATAIEEMLKPTIYWLIVHVDNHAVKSPNMLAGLVYIKELIWGKVFFMVACSGMLASLAG